MEWFQQPAAEQHDKVNGYCKPESPQDTTDVRWTPPEGESGGSDSCGGTTVSELIELKTKESEDEEHKEEGEVVSASKDPKADQVKNEKQSSDQEEDGKQNHSAASSYTGKTFILFQNSSKACPLLISANLGP